MPVALLRCWPECLVGCLVGCLTIRWKPRARGGFLLFRSRIVKLSAQTASIQATCLPAHLPYYPIHLLSSQMPNTSISRSKARMVTSYTFRSGRRHRCMSLWRCTARAREFVRDRSAFCSMEEGCAMSRHPRTLKWKMTTSLKRFVTRVQAALLETTWRITWPRVFHHPTPSCQSAQRFQSRCMQIEGVSHRVRCRGFLRSHSMSLSMLLPLTLTATEECVNRTLSTEGAFLHGLITCSNTSFMLL
mmetsp:Transcript_97596/g.142822  ORF Transcript_97596/g.142822 Transcript_97596/m.142822 type:complete len:246 (+) Transcript_97596:346-1083(+)